MQATLLRMFLIIAYALLLTGCWNMGASKRSNQFDDTVNAYRILIRWGEFEKARNYIRLRQGEMHEFDPEYYQNIRVSRYEVIDRIAVGDDPDDPREILVIIALDFNHADEVLLHTLRYEQLWWYDDEMARWFLDSNLPDFNSQMSADQQSKGRSAWPGVNQ